LPARKSQLVDLRPRLRALADQHHALFAKLAVAVAESRRLHKAVDEMLLRARDEHTLYGAILSLQQRTSSTRRRH
jgi:hypothetical protein